MKDELDENFEVTLDFLEAFLLEDDEEIEAVKDSLSKNDLLTGLLQTNLALLNRLSDREAVAPEEILRSLSNLPPEPPRLRLL